MIESLLIANRGEIACRIMRTARRLGIRTVAVYSEADAQARHVREADVAVRIGPAPARESYLHVDRIVAAALASGARAVHPGYGFLSESDHFAQACADAGLVFVGPPPAAIRAMGSKSAAKALLQGAGIPTTPGYHGDDQGADRLLAEAGRIGFPVLIKASAGGGGKGMRRVDDARDFAAALQSCRREAAAAFGSDHVLIEKYLVAPRHVEVQVFADTHGNAVHLFERDCSVQRRHQKVLEEAPAPLLPPSQRAAMGEMAVRVARAVGYVGAGTVEFIVPGDAPAGTFYFMEMNTRLQVEHPVTEMITGQDLVEWQLRVASGEPLPCSQDALAPRGHAIEARIYAEDADRDFAPSTGTVAYFEAPATGAQVRLDAGVAAGDAITPWYDPMIAKLIVWDEDRERARRRLAAALAQVRIVGLVTNTAFLGRLVNCPSFAQVRLDTGLIERERDALGAPAAEPSRQAWLIATLAHLALEARAVAARSDGASAWGRPDAWRANGPSRRRIGFAWTGAGEVLERVVDVQVQGAHWALALDGRESAGHAQWTQDDAAVLAQGGGPLLAHVDGQALPATAVREGRRWHVFAHFGHVVFECREGDAGTWDHDDGREAGAVRAPMPGRVIAVQVAEGAVVERGAPLVVVEAMKMEHTVRAPVAGRVRALQVAVGDQVQMDDVLVDLDAGDAVA